MAKHRTAQGLSLVEFLVSFSLLVLVVGGVLFSYVRCLEFIDIAKNTSRAVQAAQSQMEEIRGASFSDIYSTYNGVVLTSIPNLNGVGSVFVDNSVPDLLEVVVQVSWESRKGRIYGEDTNLNGVLDFGEDLNGNSRLDSPVELSMRIFQR